MAVEDGNITSSSTTMASVVANSLNEQGNSTMASPANHTVNAFQQAMSAPGTSSTTMNAEPTTTNDDGHHIGDHSGWNYGPNDPLGVQNEEDDRSVTTEGVTIGHNDDFPEESQGWGESLANTGRGIVGAGVGVMGGNNLGSWALGAGIYGLGSSTELSSSGNQTTDFGPDEYSSVPGPHGSDEADTGYGESDSGDSSDPTGGYGT